MSVIRILYVHRTWEDWVGMLIGLSIGCSPWLAGQPHDLAVIWNAVMVGVLVFCLAQLEYVSPRRWDEIGVLACGLWLIASPTTFGYAEAGTLRFWHFFLGAAAVLIACLELWQVRMLSDEPPARHRW